MSIPPAYTAEAILTIAFVGVDLLLFCPKIKKTFLIAVVLLSVWISVFSVFLAGEIVPVRDYVRVTALGTQSEQSMNNHICVIGYSINDVDNRLLYPAEGNWAWYLPEEKGNHYYCGWCPGSEDVQPEQEGNYTDYVLLPLPLGQNRSLNFLCTSWYGIAELAAGNTVQTVDTWGNGIIKVPIPDTSAETYAAARLRQLPAAVILVLALHALIYGILQFVLSEKCSKKLKKYRFLFSQLVRRDFTLKYKRTVLGAVWSLLSPLFTLVIMWFVFHDLLGNSIPHFVIYMFIGQTIFSFFSDATTQGMTSLLDNASIFTKVNIPKYMFLLSKNVSSLINFGLTLCLLFVFTLLEGLSISWQYLMLLYPTALLIVFNIGVGLILSALFVFFRDLQYLWGVCTQLIMWVSAIFYAIDGFDAGMQNLFLLNPIYLFIRYFRKIMIENTVPSIWFHLLMAGYAVASLLIGGLIYKKYNHEFLYYV